MNDDDQLFLRCLIVAATITGCVVSALWLAPPPRTGDGIEEIAAADEGPRGKVVVMFSMPSASRRPSLAPVRLGGESEIQAGSTSAIEAGQGPRTTGSAHTRRRGNGSALVPDPSASPSAVQSDTPTLGADTTPLRSGDIAPMQPPTAWPLKPPDIMPAMADMDPMNITVRRGGHGASEPDGGLSTQDTDDDPLPEFRRKFAPRAEVCANHVARRDHPVSGKMILKFTVEPSGWVRNARVSHDGIGDPDLRDCVQGALTSSRYFQNRTEALHAERVVLFAR